MKINLNNWKKLVIVILITFPAFSFLLKNGYYNMHDDMQMIRQLEMEKCLKDKQIPCRWSPDLGYGYGYPLFNFYPPIPYFVGQMYRTIGFSFVDSVKYTAIAQFILMAIGMYLLASSIFGPWGGIISSVFYTYAPYHALNIFVRGAMNEAWAAVFFPYLFLFSKNIISNKKNFYNYLWFSISLCGLLLSHNPMVLTFIPFLGIWILYWAYINKKILNYFLYIKFFIISIVGLALAAFFTLPVLFESKLVQIDSMFQNYYHWSVHFTSIRQLFFSNFWGNGASVWGQADGMSFMVGYFHWLIPLLIFIYSLFIYYKNKKIDKLLFLSCLLSVLGLFAIFMTHERSAFLWKILTPVQKIQFPWRFLNHAIFLLSLSVGIVPMLIKKLLPKLNKAYILNILIILLIYIANINYFTPIHYGPITDEQKFSGLNWQTQITASIYDYLPKTAKTAAKGPAKEYIDGIEPSNSEYVLTGEKKGSDWLFFNINLKQSSKITLPILVFPNFKVFDNNQEIKYHPDSELGRIVLDLNSGDHQIFVKLYNTPIRIISNWISLISWLILFLVIIYKKPWTKRLGKK